MAIDNQVKEIEADASKAIGAAGDEPALEAIRVAELGKKGRVSLLMRELGGMSPEQRQVAGPALNGLKDRLTTAISARKAELELVALNKRLETEREDLTLPSRAEPVGALHPVMQVFEELAAIFADMGFAVAEGPDIEDDFHNFTALNFPPGHPARETHDTFFLKPDASGAKKVLRTHTSPVQIRAMMAQKPPIRVIAPGRVFRKDWDATHTPMFHQIEGLVVDKNVHMGHLKSCLTEAFSRFFEVPTTQSRFRPHFFPFTEPSAEMDIRCDRSGGEIRVGEGNDWLEILGCGMVHPNVLKSCNIDPEEYQGFAFGLGVDRLAMLKYGMPDLRPYFEADVEWMPSLRFQAMAAADGDGGIIVKPCAALWPAVLMAASCTTPKVSDATRYDQPVVDTTIAAIRADPEAWDNKWVRLRGFVNGLDFVMYGDECLAKALSSRKEDSCLDEQAAPPAGQLQHRGFGFDGVDRALVDLVGYDILDLEPETRLSPDKNRDHSSFAAAIVVGRVDLDCWRWGQKVSEMVKSFMTANPGTLPEFGAPEQISYCWRLHEPHLDKVLISRGNAQ